MRVDNPATYVRSYGFIGGVMAAGIYRLVDTVTGKTYIGASKNLALRKMQHESELRIGRHKRSKTYANFYATIKEHGLTAVKFEILILCEEQDLRRYEKQCVAAYDPSENTAYKATQSAEFCAERSRRTTELWKNPEYRARAIAARKGNSYCAGYKCTPAQVENRKRAARISNMKRNYGDQWVEEYRRRYPEHASDVL